jgi:hypothetical protein
MRPTPDNGVRLSATRVWDEATRPTGPAPDPDRVYTPAQEAQGQHLVDVHDHLRAELDRLRQLMTDVLEERLDPGVARSHISRRLRSGIIEQLNTMTLRQHNWTLGAYCQTYCRVVTTHHTFEDIGMLPALRDADPRLGPVIDRLAEEHGLIHEVIERVDRALVAFVADPGRAEDVREAVNVLTDALLSHLSYEERELVEPLARLG